MNIVWDTSGPEMEDLEEDNLKTSTKMDIGQREEMCFTEVK